MSETKTNLILPYPPATNNLYANFNGRRILSTRGRAFKKEVGVLARQQGAEILSGELSIEITVFRPAKRGDLDNTIKIIQDSLKGICFRDDKQIVEIHAFRFDDKDNPRAVVTVKNI